MLGGPGLHACRGNGRGVQQLIYINKRFVRHPHLEALLERRFARAEERHLRAEGGAAAAAAAAASAGPGGGRARPSYVVAIACPASAYDVCSEPDKSLPVFRDLRPVAELLELLADQAWGPLGRADIALSSLAGVGGDTGDRVAAADDAQAPPACGHGARRTWPMRQEDADVNNAYMPMPPPGAQQGDDADNSDLLSWLQSVTGSGPAAAASRHGSAAAAAAAATAGGAQPRGGALGGLLQLQVGSRLLPPHVEMFLEALCSDSLGHPLCKRLCFSLGSCACSCW